MTEEAKKNKKFNVKTELREWVESLVIAFFLALFINTFFIQAFKIPSGSMRMTLLEGDRLIVSKLRYGPKIPFTKIRLPGFSEPKRGDVVVFIYPVDRKKDFIKRLIAVGGDTVEIRDGDIFVNDRHVIDPRIDNFYYYNRGKYAQERQKLKVPEDFYYVLGDNSASSQDSRFWGFVPKENIVGKAEFIYWPINRIRVIE